MKNAKPEGPMRHWFLAVAAIAPIAAASAAAAETPDFTGYWQHSPIAEYQPVPGSPAPVHNKRPINTNNLQTLLEGEETNPILQPWAAAEVRRRADSRREGRQIPTQQEECRASGVPGVLTLPAPVQFLQMPKETVIVYQRDHQVRHIQMNVPHTNNPPLTWYGESIGHYEGDTLVIDTIGMKAMSSVDIFGTPHTEALHVVERYRLIDNGKKLEAVIQVDDAGAFTAPWSGSMVYDRANVPALIEEVCAENNFDVVTKKPYPIPFAANPDF
jgi:hypothetical protein